MIGGEPLHLCIDMQRLFHEGTSWASAAPARVLPNVLRIARTFERTTLFTRFITPETAKGAPRHWRPYYEAWPDVVRERMDPALLDLLPPLDRLAANARVVDKPTFGVFAHPPAAAAIEAMEPGRLVFTGVETDVCVLASLWGAIDRGYHCTVIADAVASSDEAGHQAVLAHVLPRLPEFIEVTTTEAFLRGHAR